MVLYSLFFVQRCCPHCHAGSITVRIAYKKPPLLTAEMILIKYNDPFPETICDIGKYVKYLVTILR